jgi:hypothetical protein
MIVAMMQPSFLPWQGFFELVWRSETFILLDDFQFSNQSYHQRNRLFVAPGAVDWWTVPVHKAQASKMPLTRVRIDDSGPWRKKMLRRLQANYARTPFFDVVYPEIEAWLAAPAESLAELNIGFIELVLRLFGWQRQLHRSSAFPSDAVRSQRVVALLREFDATVYLAARGSFGYMQEDGVFPVPGLDVQFQDFAAQPYRQAGNPARFEVLSVLDALLNIGPHETAALVAAGTPQWRGWQEMINTLQPIAGAPGESHGI